MALVPTKRVGLGTLAAVAAACAFAGPAAADGSYTLGENDSAEWSGGGTGAYVVYPALGCEGLTPLDACDATLVNADGADSLTITLTAGATDDYDLFVYPNNDFNADPVEGTTGEGPGVAENVTIANPSGTYLVEIVGFLSLNGAFNAVATTTSSAALAARSARQSALDAQAAALADAVHRASL